MIISQAQPLPPKVNGDLIGSLTIQLKRVEPPNSFARIHFWGEESFLNISVSSAVEYPLIGSIHSLDGYMKDASPLRVSFFHHSKCQGQQIELVGYASIHDLCITDKLRAGCPSTQDSSVATPNNTIKLSLRREVSIVSSDSDNSDSKVGEAVFELLFRVIVPSSTLQPNDVAGQPALRDELSMCPQHANITQPLHHYTSQHLPPNQCGSSQFDSSSELYSSIEEKQSILEELLDICADDYTVPTIDSSLPSCCIDPYDMWISRMVHKASSPPPKEFPSLVLLGGSHQSRGLRKVGLLKLEIHECSLLSCVTNSLAGKHDFYLQYNNSPTSPSPNTPSLTSTSALTEFIVCEQFVGCNQSKRRTPSSKVAGKKKSSGSIASLLTSVHTNELKVAFKDDETVSQWLDGNIKFSLLSRASKSAGHSKKLPRVAMLSGRRKEDSVDCDKKICLAKASLSLRDLLLSKTLTKDIRLDLVLVSNGDKDLVVDVGKAGTKVGSLSVKIGLYEYPGHNDVCADNASIPSSQPGKEHTEVLNTNDGKTDIKVEGHSRQSTSCHPISVFLSNFAGDGKRPGDDRANIKDSKECSEKIQPQHQTEFHSSATSITSKTKSQTSQDHSTGTATLKPVKAPPIWLDLRVERISKLNNSISDSVKIGISCNEPILPLGERGMEEKTVTANFHATSTICSWQIALDAEERKEDEATVITLSFFSSDLTQESQTLIGLTKVSFLINLTSNTFLQQSWLPVIATNNWFDILDPKSHTSIGKVQVLVATGMLRQIRGFAAVCKSATIIRQWWRRRLRSGVVGLSKAEAAEQTTTSSTSTSLHEHPEEEEDLNLSEIKQDDDSRSVIVGVSKAEAAEPTPTSTSTLLHEPEEEDLNLSEIKQDDDSLIPSLDDPEFDTVHAGFIAQHKTADDTEKGSIAGDLTSSPDSLYAEWSQQSEPQSLHLRPSTETDNTRFVAAAATSSSTSTSSIDYEDVTLDTAIKDDGTSVIEEREGSKEGNSSSAEPHKAASNTYNTTIKNKFSSQLQGTTVQGDDHAQMSTLKPTNLLQVSFSHGQQEIDDSTKKNNKPDPPEEIPMPIPPSKAPSSAKRKIGVSSKDQAIVEAREYKRYRVKEQPNATIKLLLHEEKTTLNNKKHDDSEESETICPSDSSSMECDQHHQEEDSDADDDADLTFRSLSSVMGSLEDINNILTTRGANLQNDSDEPDDIIDGERDIQSKQRSEPTAKQSPSPKQKRQDCPAVGRQLEPPDDNALETPGRIVSSNDDRPDKVIQQTCEKSSSPMSTTNLYADKTTSPSESLMMANTRIEETERGRKVDTAKKEEECDDVGTGEGSASRHVEQLPRIDQPDIDAANHIPLDRHLLTTNRLGRTPHPRRYSTLLSPHHRLGKALSYQLGKSTHVTSPLSPLRNGILSRPRSSWRDKKNAKIVGKKNDDKKSKSDRERLERIFKSKIL